MRKKIQFQTYNDGIVNIYEVGNVAEPGEMPKDGLTLKVGPIRYDERTVGMNRFWTAMQSNARIDLVIRIPRIRTINIHDVAVVNGEQYDIRQIQNPKDIEPPSTDLSLQRLSTRYEMRDGS